MSKDLRKDTVKLLMVLGAAHRRLISKELSTLNIFSGQYKILMYLNDREDDLPSQKEIAETFDISPAAVTIAMNKLEDGGIIKRKVRKKDNRVYNVVLTDAGKALTQKAKEKVDKVTNEFFSDLDDSEFEIVYNILSKVDYSDK